MPIRAVPGAWPCRHRGKRSARRPISRADPASATQRFPAVAAERAQRAQVASTIASVSPNAATARSTVLAQEVQHRPGERLVALLTSSARCRRSGSRDESSPPGSRLRGPGRSAPASASSRKSFSPRTRAGCGQMSSVGAISAGSAPARSSSSARRLARSSPSRRPAWTTKRTCPCRTTTLANGQRSRPTTACSSQARALVVQRRSRSGSSGGDLFIARHLHRCRSPQGCGSAVEQLQGSATTTSEKPTRLAVPPGRRARSRDDQHTRSAPSSCAAPSPGNRRRAGDARSGGQRHLGDRPPGRRGKGLGRAHQQEALAVGAEDEHERQQERRHGVLP